MKILNLYAGIGGNRKFWNDHQITAVENEVEVAECYSDNFPGDLIFVEDVHDFIMENDLDEYDFIWASPPCVTHTCLQMSRGYNIPNMTELYGLMTHLKYSRQNRPWVIENVRPWYMPLVRQTVVIGRHYFWSNFYIAKMFDLKSIAFQVRGKDGGDNEMSYNQLKRVIGLETKKIDGLSDMVRRKIVRNCLRPEIGKHIIDQLSAYKSLDDWCK